MFAAGCGSEPAAEPERTGRTERQAPPPKVTKAQVVDRLDAACRRAASRWSNPLAAEAKLPPSPIQTTAEGDARRVAKMLRGYRAILQDVLDEVKRKPWPAERRGALRWYEIELSRALTELEGEELIIRQSWNRQSLRLVIRDHLRRARRHAARYGLEACARLRTTPPF